MKQVCNQHFWGNATDGNPCEKCGTKVKNNQDNWKERFNKLSICCADCILVS